ncbi:MAG: TRAP transporter small permease [Micromonosporaceae bacterium]
MSGFDRVLTRVEDGLAAGFLGLAALVAIVSVILRFVFGVFVFWSEEAIIYSIICSTFLGAVITLRHNEHVKVDLVAPFVGKFGTRAMAILGAAVTVIYLAVVGGFGWLLLFEPFSSQTVTPALKLPLWVVELAVPIGFTLMCLRALEILYRVSRGRTAFDEAEKSLLEHEAEAAGLKAPGADDAGLTFRKASDD